MTNIERRAWQAAFDWYSHQQLLIKFDIKRAKAKRFIMTQTSNIGIK